MSNFLRGIAVLELVALVVLVGLALQEESPLIALLPYVIGGVTFAAVFFALARLLEDVSEILYRVKPSEDAIENGGFVQSSSTDFTHRCPACNAPVASDARVCTICSQEL